MAVWVRYGAALVVELTGAATAQTSIQPATAPTLQVAPAAPVIASTTDRGVQIGTLVELEIGVGLNSKTSKIGDMFPIYLAEPVLDRDGGVLIPTGTAGQGEVIHAAKARALGKAGEIILAARYLRCGETRIPLGHFKFGARGKDNSQVIGAAIIAGGVLATPLLFVSGGEINVPIGTRATAKITADVALTTETTAQCRVDPQPAGEKGSQ